MTNTASNLYVNNRVVKKILFNDAEMYTSKGWAYKPEDYSYSKILTDKGSAQTWRLYSDNQLNIYSSADYYWSNPASNNSGVRTVLTKYNSLGIKSWSSDSSDLITTLLPTDKKYYLISATYTYVTADAANNDVLWAILHTYSRTTSSYYQVLDYLVKIDNKTGAILQTIDIHKAGAFSDDPSNDYIVYGLVANKGNVFLILSWEHQYYQDNGSWTNYSRYFFMFDNSGNLKQKLEKSVTYRQVKGMAMNSTEDIVFIIYNTAYIVRKADNYSSIKTIGALSPESENSSSQDLVSKCLAIDTIGTIYCATKNYIKKYSKGNFFGDDYYVSISDEKGTAYGLDISRIAVDGDDCLYVLASGRNNVSTNNDAKDYLFKYNPNSTLLWVYKTNKGAISPDSLASFGSGIGFAQPISGVSGADIGMLSGIPKKY